MITVAVMAIASAVARMFDHLVVKPRIRRLAQEVIAKTRGESDTQRGDGCRNMAGLGGMGFRPRFVAWQTLFEQSSELRGWGNHPYVVRETLFFGYFAPLEAWCDHNCQGPYYLWSDKVGIYLQLSDPMDDMLFKLTYGLDMPNLSEV